MNFDALTTMIQPALLDTLKAQSAHEPMSVTFYKCSWGHQAVEVRSGTDTFSKLDHRGRHGECLRCLKARRAIVMMK